MGKGGIKSCRQKLSWLCIRITKCDKIHLTDLSKVYQNGITWRHERRFWQASGASYKATSELKLNLSKLAREYTNDALDTLVEVIQSSQSDSARIAAIAILDRGYGRPTKTTSLEVNAPFVATKIQLVAYTGS